jgi:hypothetical protein
MEESQAGWPASGALFLIRSPSDEQVYKCFRGLAQRFAPYVKHESLWIEGNVPLSAAFAAAEPPPAIQRLIDAESSIVTRMELQLGGLMVAFVRSGGVGPPMYRESYFDELRLATHGSLELRHEQIEDIVAGLHTCLDAVAVTGGELVVSAASKVGVPVRHGPSDWGAARH